MGARALVPSEQKLLAFRAESPIFPPSRDWHGLVAQLEERLNGIEEVVSSILIGSTNYPRPPAGISVS